ncbi:metallophosphoesterase [Paenibacillus herberti]|uniref:Phosphoesterase n=1 Tax=Paenibacillus herberti TaxID=1619309 RepID=A0A229P2F2_9BACL|nr:metallophosphoesterase [Paenibacillus herberti]OXM16412.1 phosphoesterase [Paenibacillus herberti]
MLRRIIGFTVFLLLFAAITYYIGWNLSLFLSSLGIDQHVWMWLVVSFLSLSYLIAMALIRLWGGLPVRLFKLAASYYLAVIEFLILLLPLANLGWLIAAAAGVGREKYNEAAGWSVLLLLVLLLVWGSRNAWSPIVRRFNLHVDKHVPGRESLTLLAASDIHLGDIVGKRHLSRLVRISKELEPDLILLAGDVIDDSVKPFIRQNMAKVISQLKAPLGTYAVLGNHEYYGGHISEYTAKMAEAGIPVLQDQVVQTGGLYIAGRKDKTAEAMSAEGRISTAELLSQADASAPIFLMDHQPYGFAQAAEAGADLLLCGHTHRGQFAPNHLVTRRLFELDWGYMRKSALHVLVSSGFGSWGPPIRLFSRSEVLLVTFTFKK